MDNQLNDNDYEHNDGLGDLLKEREKLEFSWAKTAVVAGVLLAVIILSGSFIFKFGKDIANKNQTTSKTTKVEESFSNEDLDPYYEPLETSITKKSPSDTSDKLVSKEETPQKKEALKKAPPKKIETPAKQVEKKSKTVKKTAAKQSYSYYKVIAGTFKNKKYAKSLIKKLKMSGFDGFYKPIKSSKGATLYRVQAGSFFKKSDAESFKKRLSTKNFQSYIIKE